MRRLNVQSTQQQSHPIPRTALVQRRSARSGVPSLAMSDKEKGDASESAYPPPTKLTREQVGVVRDRDRKTERERNGADARTQL